MSNEKYKAKVKHVKKAEDTGDHHCHGGMPGCRGTCKPAAWGCYPCWQKLPKRLRDMIWAAYEVGQEKTKTPSREYVSVAREVQQWIDQKYPTRKR